jgi:primosomal protein N' (replication factor Y)
MTDGGVFFPAGTPLGVLLADGPGHVLDYRAPEGGCRTGDFVAVPLGRREELPGVVWGPPQGAIPAERLRDVARVLDVAPMRDELRRFLVRAADYALAPPGAMLRLATRVPGLGAPPPERRIVHAAEGSAAKGAARQRVLDVLARYGGAGLAPTDLAREAGVGTGVIASMSAAGALVVTRMRRDLPYPVPDPDLPGPQLSPDQIRAASALSSAVRGGGYGTTLLRGVTGSGKTEVYLEAVAACLGAGRQALVLMPEIALGAGVIARFEARFGARPAEWHSGVGPAERRRLWSAVAEGGARIVIGARSALFLPFRDLGVIIVDEEHDSSYKQEDGVHYHARDMAVLRGAIAGAQVVLASATPSLESWVNAQNGKYGLLELPSRFGDAVLPEIAAVDMRADAPPPGRWISDPVAAALGARLRAGEQSLIFLNRRGYAPVTLCRSCGNQIGCPDCDARLVEHRTARRLVCHRCGHSRPIPTACPACGAEGQLAAVGPGVERIAAEVAERFPAARVRVLASDLFGSARALREAVADIAAGGADIIIGTQIVAKGHDFPNLTFVGVIDADLGLQGSDLRAGERCFQLISQVAGRAGRRVRRGRVLVQTYSPEHPVMRAIVAGDDEGFRQAEAAARKAAGMPPFGRLAAIVLSGPDAPETFAAADALAAAADPLRRSGAELWGPAPAPVARIRGLHRVRMLIRADRHVALQPAIAAWLDGVRLPRRVRLVVDIDPQSFL